MTANDLKHAIMLAHFGEPWTRGIKERYPQCVLPPQDVCCIWCLESFVDGDQGVAAVPPPDLRLVDETPYEYVLEVDIGVVAFHKDCWLRLTLCDGLNHQAKLCACFGGSEPADPADMSLREAAAAAVRSWRESNEAFV